VSNRHGFTLLVALWLIVAISTVVALALSDERLHSMATRNRLALMRAEWARDACAAVLQARYEYADPLRGVDSVDLGRSTWCTARASDPSARLDVNRASSGQLRAFFGSDSLADALMDWRDADDVPRAHGAEASSYLAFGRPVPANRPFGSIAELRRVRGFEVASLDSLGRVLTVRGHGALNITTADPAVVATLPGLRPADATVLRAVRASGWQAQSLEELIGRLGGNRQEELAEWMPDLRAAVSFRPAEVVIEVVGAGGADPVRARATLNAVPLPERLAIVRRVLW
jgi:general secretion pathway protein K